MARHRGSQRVLAHLALCLLILLSVPAGGSISGTFTIFDAPGAGTGFGQGTSPQAINAGGDIAGYYTDREDVPHGFIRRNDNTVTEFDVPGGNTTSGSGTSPQSINDDGDVAGFYVDSNRVRHGFVRNVDGTFQTLDPAGSIGTVIQGINGHGNVIGNYVAGDVAHGFMQRKNGEIISFDPPASFNTAPMSINARDEIAGYYADVNDVLHGFVRHSDGTFTTFDAPPASTRGGQGTFPMSINDDGTISGYYSDAVGARRAFLRTTNSAFTLFDPPGGITDNLTHTDPEGYIVRPVVAPLSLNQVGEIAGYYGDLIGVVHGFVRYKDGTFATFEAPNASAKGGLGTFPQSINKNQEVAGYYYTATTGALRGFVLKPPRGSPAPATKSPQKPQ